MNWKTPAAVALAIAALAFYAEVVSGPEQPGIISGVGGVKRQAATQPLATTAPASAAR